MTGHTYGGVWVFHAKAFPFSTVVKGGAPDVTMIHVDLCVFSQASQ